MQQVLKRSSRTSERARYGFVGFFEMLFFGPFRCTHAFFLRARSPIQFLYILFFFSSACFQASKFEELQQSTQALLFAGKDQTSMAACLIAPEGTVSPASAVHDDDDDRRRRRVARRCCHADDAAAGYSCLLLELQSKKDVTVGLSDIAEEVLKSLAWGAPSSCRVLLVIFGDNYAETVLSEGQAFRVFPPKSTIHKFTGKKQAECLRGKTVETPANLTVLVLGKDLADEMLLVVERSSTAKRAAAEPAESQRPVKQRKAAASADGGENQLKRNVGLLF
jgi:hypothetical protein